MPGRFVPYKETVGWKTRGQVLMLQPNHFHNVLTRVIRLQIVFIYTIKMRKASHWRAPLWSRTTSLHLSLTTWDGICLQRKRVGCLVKTMMNETETEIWNVTDKMFLPVSQPVCVHVTFIEHPTIPIPTTLVWVRHHRTVQPFTHVVNTDAPKKPQPPPPPTLF